MNVIKMLQSIQKVVLFRV